jgi:CheY-like chemotaxis protein/anti-sigma regulatory factor (Ser/Thr protein kinase)
MVFGDAGRLQQVIWNLLSNAVKFTSEGGRVEIHLSYLDSKAEIIVKDTGKGISSEFLPYVFEYFRQADSSITRSFGGLGLGLAIARQITEMHGGTIQAESPGEEQGATFTVTLPLITTTVESTEPLVPATLSGLQGVKVLAVDDERDNLELITFILEEAGATVTAVASGPEALRVLPQFQPDVLVSDIGMPEMNGYTLVQQVQAYLLKSGEIIPAIALTAYAGEANQQQAFAAGFQVHLSKPVEPIELVATIAALVRAQKSDSSKG